MKRGYRGGTALRYRSPSQPLWRPARLPVVLGTLVTLLSSVALVAQAASTAARQDRTAWEAVSPMVSESSPGTDARSNIRQGHARWTQLLERCVQLTRDGGSTTADYGCFRDNRAELDAYLASLSAVEHRDYERWSRDERLAFLINVYNAFTVDLILSAWPDLESIRDLGGLFSSPWEKSFVSLFGESISLDEIEHGMIREPGRFDEPRIHFAVNCASIGCPALRREAYRGRDLDAQLTSQTRQFLGDRSRNRLRDERLELSPLFKWYRQDFENGWRGINSLREFLARYADALGLNAAERSALVRGEYRLRFLDYDWSLNSPEETAP